MTSEQSAGKKRQVASVMLGNSQISTVNNGTKKQLRVVATSKPVISNPRPPNALQKAREQQAQN